jgi:hypothetical protein
MDTDKGRKEGKGLFSQNILRVMAMGLAVPVLITPAMLIIMNAPRFGIWWLPLLFLYLLPFTTGQLFLVRRREMNRIHGLVGDEMFYIIYPKELKRDLRKARKEGIPPHIAETVAMYSDQVSGALSTDPRERKAQLQQEQKKQMALDLYELGVIDETELRLRMEGK